MDIYETYETYDDVSMSNEVREYLRQSKKDLETADLKELTYTQCSLDTLCSADYKSKLVESPEESYIRKKTSERFWEIMSTMTDMQKRIITLLSENVSVSEIANRENVSADSVEDMLLEIRRSFKEIF